MSFIKQFTDNLLSMEFRTINNMNDNTILSDESKYMGLCKFTGNTMYIVVAINGDNPDYEIITHGLQNFLAMEKRFNVVSLFVYFKEKVDEKIINYCNVDILDYNAPYVELKWVVDILEKKIIVNGQQPNKLIDIEKAINSALNMEGYDVATDVRDLEKKHIENRAKNVKTNNIAFSSSADAVVLLNPEPSIESKAASVECALVLARSNAMSNCAALDEVAVNVYPVILFIPLLKLSALDEACFKLEDNNLVLLFELFIEEDNLVALDDAVSKLPELIVLIEVLSLYALFIDVSIEVVNSFAELDN